MMKKDQSRIYWANALFSEADRKFNESCAEILRSVGYSVFLPQETPMTFDKQPKNSEIFEIDTEEIRVCDALIACIDQFPIDSGVACEIGIAYALKKTVIGLYTDIRSKREGEGRMYKNQYVMGAIESAGVIVDTIDQLLQVLPKYV